MDAPSLPESLMKKRLLLVLAFLCGLAAPAFAGDAAELEILGFSENGGIFAFEEYGVQDGSGFPYANRYYIDTEKDAYLPGTPVRIRLDDESATIEKARAQAREAGEKFVANDILARNRGNLAGFNAITELSADPLRMEVSPRAIFPPIDKKLEFRLEEYVLPSNAECMDFNEIKGFRLSRIDTSDGGTTRIVHEDKTIPQTRSCALGYRIGAVQTFFPDNGEAVYAVVIAVRRVGFEGPDHRWIAVAGRL
jgi:predicted secreted protein